MGRGGTHADESAGVGRGCFGLDLLHKSIFEFGGGRIGGGGTERHFDYFRM